MNNKYEFDVLLRKGKWEVKVDTGARYGFYEHDDQGEGGGLWFEVDAEKSNGRNLSLTDYDGRAVLPRGVADALREAGFVVDEDFN